MSSGDGRNGRAITPARWAAGAADSVRGQGAYQRDPAGGRGVTRGTMRGSAVTPANAGGHHSLASDRRADSEGGLPRSRG